MKIVDWLLIFLAQLIGSRVALTARLRLAIAWTLEPAYASVSRFKLNMFLRPYRFSRRT